MKLDNFLRYRFIYNRLPLFLLLILLLSSCMITPELDERVDLTPARTQIANPTNLTVKNNNDENNPSIELTWDLVNNATYYVVYYQKATDYLSNAEWKKSIVHENQFTLNSGNFSDPDDMRYVFKVSSGVVTTSNANIESTGTDLKEGAIVNDFTVSQVISDNVLKLYSSCPDNQSVLSDGNIVEPTIIYYENGSEDKVIDPSGRELSSAEKLNIKAVLYIDDVEIKSKEFTVQNSINYIPPALIELNGSKNELGQITLTWKAEDINVGLDSENTKLKFEILRKKKDSTEEYKSLILIDSDNTDYQQRDSDDSIEYYKYVDTNLDDNATYTYQVVSYYYLNINDKEVIYSESKNTRKSVDAYALYNMPKTFTVEKQSGFDEVQTGDATYTVKLNWSYYNDELPENVKVMITCWDFSLTTIVDGNPTDEATTEEKSRKVYEGSDFTEFVDTITLTAEKNKKEQKYVYYIYLLYNDVQLGEMTMAKFDDGRDGIVATLPSVQQVNFIKEYSASTDYADCIYLSWELDTDAIASAGLDSSKVKMSILKSDGSTYPVYQDKITETSFTDTAIDEKGKEYSYILKPYYDDSESPYNGDQSTTEPFKGKTLGEVTNISATENTYNDKIVVKWDSVANAKGYDIYYRKNGIDTYTKYNTEVISDTTEATLEGLDVGIDYDIVVGVVDNYDNSVYNKDSAVIGSILGAITPTVSTDKSDYIEVKWDEVKNVTKYAVKVFSDTTTVTETLYQEVRAGEDTSWSFSADDILNVATWEYPLSRQYYVTVTPYVNKVSAEPTERTAGNWIMPPKNITATKALYRDMIKISWTAVDSISTYNVYYREKDSTNSWKLLGYSSANGYTHYDADGEFEYTVSTLKDNESRLQNYFDFDSENNEYNNLGYNIIAPKRVSAEERSTSDKLIEVTFGEVPGATSYLININGETDSTYNFEVVLDDSNKTASTSPSAKKYYIDSTGLVHYFFARLDATKSIANTVFVRSKNSNGLVEDRKTSVATTTVYIPNELYASEVVNMVNTALNSVFTVVNNAFEGDWWGGTAPTQDSSKEYIGSNYAIYSSSQATQSNGSASFSSFEYNGISISSDNKLELHAADGGGVWKKGYLGVDPLQWISGTIYVSLPYEFGTKTVVFSQYYVDGTSGSVSVNGENVSSGDIKSYILK